MTRTSDNTDRGTMMDQEAVSEKPKVQTSVMNSSSASSCLLTPGPGLPLLDEKSDIYSGSSRSAEDLAHLARTASYPRRQDQHHDATRPISFTDDCPDVPLNRGSSSEAKEPIWDMYNKEADKFDKSLVEEWKEGLDTLLIFAGLFSAVLTALLVTVYPTLQVDKAQATVDALTAISAQLTALSASQTPFPRQFQPQPLPTPSISALWVNSLWFCALALSIVASLSVLVVKQWIRAYSNQGHFAGHDDRCRRRQLRYDGVIKWHMPNIIRALPLIIQISVLLFLSGLTIFTWNIHITLGKIILVIASITAAVYAVVAVLPLVYIDCPYNSEITRLLLYLFYTGTELGNSFRRLVMRYKSSLGLAAYEKREGFWEVVRSRARLRMWARDFPSISEFTREIDTRAFAWLVSNVHHSRVLETGIVALAGYGVPEEIWKNPWDAVGLMDAAVTVLHKRVNRAVNSDDPEGRVQELPELTGIVSMMCTYRTLSAWSLGKSPSKDLNKLFRLASDQACLSDGSSFLARSVELFGTCWQDGLFPAQDVYAPRDDHWCSAPSESESEQKRNAVNSLISRLIEDLGRDQDLSLFGVCLFFHFMGLRGNDGGELDVTNRAALLRFVRRLIAGEQQVAPALKLAICDWYDRVTPPPWTELPWVGRILLSRMSHNRLLRLYKSFRDNSLSLEERWEAVCEFIMCNGDVDIGRQRGLSPHGPWSLYRCLFPSVLEAGAVAEWGNKGSPNGVMQP